MKYKLVPVNPTREMWAAAGNAVIALNSQHHDAISEAVYKAMLAAAPDVEQKPYAYEYGLDNGDGTFSVVINKGSFAQLKKNEFGYLPPFDTASKERPVTPLYLHPQPAPEVAKLVEALEGILSIASESFGVAGYHLNGVVADWDEFEEVRAAEDALKLHSKKSPWVPVSERLPEPGVSVLVYSPCDALYFDHIDEDCDDGDRWYGHDQSYEHYCNVAKPAGSVGPDCDAPYTHWMLIPNPPEMKS